MNIRDVYGVDSAQQLYELASNFGINVGSMDKLIRFALELQRRAIAAHALDRMVENAEALDLYDGRLK